MRIIAIICFFAVATVVSGVFRSPFYDFYNTDAFPFLAAFAMGAFVIGFGPSLAAILSWRLFGSMGKQATLVGTWPAGAWLSLLMPPAVMAAFPYTNDAGIEPHLYGATIGAIIVIYAVFEEIGWRGFLNDALRPAGFWLRVLVTGTLWWAWHLWFLDGTSIETLHLTDNWQRLVGLYVGLLGASAIFVSVVDKTKSLLLAGAFHAVGNVAFFAGSLSDLPQSQRFIMAGIIIAALIGLNALWRRRGAV